jgi:hypothetical protein
MSIPSLVPSQRFVAPIMLHYLAHRLPRMMDSQVKTIEFLHLLPEMRNQIYHHVLGNHVVIRVPPQSTIPSRRLEHDSETTGWHVLEKVQDYMTHIVSIKSDSL